MTRRAGVGGATAALVALSLLVSFRSPSAPNARCSPGFIAIGARCCANRAGNATLDRGVCPSHEVVAGFCPAPLRATPAGCDAPDTRVHVPKTEVLIGPSDWEAEGRVSPRLVTAGPFALDAFEMTVGRYGAARAASAHDDSDAFAAERGARDVARAVSGVTAREAAVACATRGGRLPTEDEWIVAAAGANARRYPWGDTGAVCRRAAFGLVTGPCASGAVGPDTVGAHEAGKSPLGIYDLAGNVAEWVMVGTVVTGAPVGELRNETVADASRAFVARGGSWASALATELRTWSRLETSPDAHDQQIGFRCAYDE